MHTVGLPRFARNDTLIERWFMSPFANTPQPPYYVVAFTTQRKEGDHGYEAMAEKMLELAAQQEGYLGVESVRGADGFGITNSYWGSLASIAAW
jgi:hypothetical protein